MPQQSKKLHRTPQTIESYDYIPKTEGGRRANKTHKSTSHLPPMRPWKWKETPFLKYTLTLTHKRIHFRHHLTLESIAIVICSSEQKMAQLKLDERLVLPLRYSSTEMPCSMLPMERESSSMSRNARFRCDCRLDLRSFSSLSSFESSKRLLTCSFAHFSISASPLRSFKTCISTRHVVLITVITLL